MAGTPGKKNQNPILPPGFPIDNPALLKRAEEICGGMIPSHAYVRACKEHCRPPHMKRGTSCYEGLIEAEHEMFYELGYYRKEDYVILQIPIGKKLTGIFELEMSDGEKKKFEPIHL